MKKDADEIGNYLLILEQTPVRITTAIQNYDSIYLSTRTEAEPWSINDILAHLRACADVWGKSMLKMIDQDYPTIRYVSPRTYMRKTDYPELAFQENLKAFNEQRRKLLETLTGLEPVVWSRRAAIIQSDKIKDQSVMDYARRIALHEITHCEQIEGWRI